MNLFVNVLVGNLKEGIEYPCGRVIGGNKWRGLWPVTGKEQVESYASVLELRRFCL